jgi:hypothetical protein
MSSQVLRDHPLTVTTPVAHAFWGLLFYKMVSSLGISFQSLRGEDPKTAASLVVSLNHLLPRVLEVE